MYIVVRRGAFETIDEGGRLAGLAAVQVLHEFDADPEWRRAAGQGRPARPQPFASGRACSRSRTPRRATASSRCRPAGAPSAATR